MTKVDRDASTCHKQNGFDIGRGAPARKSQNTSLPWSVLPCVRIFLSTKDIAKGDHKYITLSTTIDLRGDLTPDLTDPWES
jgi:hypothetical protein